MTGTVATAVLLTRKELTSLPQRRLTIETDDALQAQLRRILPSRAAGYAEWLSHQDAPAWVRWHWYFDDGAQRFVIPPHGIESNITLLDLDGITPLPRNVLVEFVGRLIRRIPDWHPKMRAFAALPADSAWSESRAALAPASHSDGTNRWATAIVRELAQLPDAKQFAQISKIARERFGFNHTLAMARDARDPSVYVVEDNHLSRWQEIYQREQLILIDPRLTGDAGPRTWCARELQTENAAFWNVALAHGIGSGWLMRSADGSATLVLSRPDKDICASEMETIEPNLRVLASFAHQLMMRMLGGPARHRERRHERALPDNDLEIIGHLQRGKGRKEISSLMGFSIPTLDRRIKFIKDKLGVDKLPQIVDVATRMGLLFPL